MTRVLLISAVLTGCFYTDPINQRPSLDIHQASPGAPVHRAETVTLTAVKTDPDGDFVGVLWRAYACTKTACDAVEFDSGADTAFTFTLPPTRSEAGNFDTLHVVLDGHDSYGATARPSQTLDLNVVDAAPTLELRKDPRHAYVVNTPIGIYAKVGDPDDGASVVTADWQVFTPATNPTFDLVDLADDAAHVQRGKTFTPHGLGDWDIQVTATDPQALTAVEHMPVHVVADHPPCLAQWDPIAPLTVGSTVPLTAPTLFQVLVVSDDLDPYPAVPNDPVLGTTEFHWSIVPPGGARQSLGGVTGSAVALDPASYIPGDLVELRVEIQDRTHTAVNCPVGDLTCSVISDASCIQRLSWQIEVR